jgi:hypothetical protein
MVQMRRNLREAGFARAVGSFVKVSEHMSRTCKQKLPRAIALYLSTALCLSTAFLPIAVLIGSLGSQHPHLLLFTALFAVVGVPVEAFIGAQRIGCIAFSQFKRPRKAPSLLAAGICAAAVLLPWLYDWFIILCIVVLPDSWDFR